MQKIDELPHLDLESRIHNPEAAGMSLKFENFKSFFANQISNILENKTLSALTIATAFAATIELTEPQKNDSSQWHRQHISSQESKNQVNLNLPYQPAKVQNVSKTLWYVDINNKKIVIDELAILNDALKYYLDHDIYRSYIIKNETIWLEFVNYISEDTYNTHNMIYTYHQLWEAIQDYYALAPLIQKQSESPEMMIQSQRVFHEKLRSKQKTKYIWSETVPESDKYDLIHDAAEYNYEYILGESYDQKSMMSVTNKIDNWEYNEQMLIQYAEELRKFIEIDAWFNLDNFENYTESMNWKNMIANNTNIEKREEY